MNNNFSENNDLVSLISVLNTQKIIDQIIFDGSEILYDKYLQTHQPFYESQDLCDQCYNVAKQYFQIKDNGETEESIQTQWKEEKEPIIEQFQVQKQNIQYMNQIMKMIQVILKVLQVMQVEFQVYL
ncbi:hypothetical protein IMG5_169970, partial [Ichthyophthirius multifiliis]